jgi:hypothetical protein
VEIVMGAGEGQVREYRLATMLLNNDVIDGSLPKPVTLANATLIGSVTVKSLPRHNLIMRKPNFHVWAFKQIRQKA